MSRLMCVRTAKTQISLGIRPVSSKSLLSAWRKLGSLATHWAQSEDSDQTGRMLVLSCRGSYCKTFIYCRNCHASKFSKRKHTCGEWTCHCVTIILGPSSVVNSLDFRWGIGGFNFRQRNVLLNIRNLFNFRFFLLSLTTLQVLFIYRPPFYNALAILAWSGTTAYTCMPYLSFLKILLVKSHAVQDSMDTLGPRGH